MQLQRETTPARLRRHLCVIAAAILGLSIGLFCTRHSEPETVRNSQTGVSGRDTASRPGVWAGPTLHTWPDDPGLAVTGNHELIVNAALLDLINFFLLEQADDDRSAQLKLYLKSKLPSPAYDEAVQIVEHYQIYMKAHDDLLAAQNLGAHKLDSSAIDISRFAVWRQQRDHLRQSILGDKVVQAWYQNDDAQLTQVIDEWQQRVEDDSAPVSPTLTVHYPVPHWHNKSGEEQHRQYMLGVLNKAATSFATLRREGRQPEP